MARKDDRRKQEHEQALFRTFIQHAGLSFDSYVSGEPPEPDIIGTRAGALVGIEITEFYRRAAKRHEVEQDLVLERASEIYLTLNAPFVSVSVSWAPFFLITKRNRDVLARRLANVVALHVPRPVAYTTLEWADLGRDLLEAVNYVSIDRMVPYACSYWNAARGGAVPDWTPAVLQAEIERKNAKPLKYRGQYVETWLLIVSAFGSPAAWMELTEQTRTHTYQSNFSRAFVLSSFPLQGLELKVSPSSGE